MKGLKLVAATGAIACLFPSVAIAQTTQLDPTDTAYLNDLYYFLEQEDAFTYSMATESLTSEDHILVAQTFCQAFEAGLSPADTLMTYMSAAVDEASVQSGGYASEDIVYALSLHSSMAMAVGTSYYCPQYQQQVNQDLEAIANGSIDNTVDSTGGKPVKF